SYTAACALCEVSLKFVKSFDASPNAVRKLNEAEPLWNIPPNLFDTVRRSLAAPENTRLMRRAHRQYVNWSDDLARPGLVENPPFNGFHAAIAAANKTIEQYPLEGLAAAASTPFTDARDRGKNAFYSA